MQKEKELEHIGTALVRAQLKFTTAPCSGYNPHFDSYYAMLKDFIDSCRTALNQEGILVHFEMGFTPERTEAAVKEWKPNADGDDTEVISKTHYPREDYLKLKLILEEQCLTSVCQLPKTDNMQTRKGAHTYAMRILLEGALCIDSEEIDDDGSAATGKTQMSDDSFKASKNKKSGSRTNYRKAGTSRRPQEKSEGQADELFVK